MKIKDIIEVIRREFSDKDLIIIDAENSILGRLSTIIAKLLLEGYKIYVVNAEKAVISGERNRVINGYKLLLEVKTHKNPYRGPKRPRSPVSIFKRTVRGMLPKESSKGFEAYKRLRVFIGVPEELRNRPKIKIPSADASLLKGEYIYVYEVAKALGWKGE